MADSKQVVTSTACLGPAAIEEAVEGASVTKATMPAAKTFVLAMLAGGFIAFGALFFMVFISDSTLTWGVQRLVGGICFCLGLVLVLCCGAELFTGNSLMACGLRAHKISAPALARAWVVVWLGNLVGSLVVVALVYFSGIYKMNGGDIANTMVSVAAGKVNLSLAEMFFRGILCNIFVCLSVWIGFGAKTTTDKIIGILLPISGFVACGFEHSVANMFFLPMGAVMHLAGFGADVTGATALGFAGIATNLAMVTLGNIVGGSLFVGLAYWFVYGRKEK